ncbi:MAG: class SAM-dependent methyltransferase [Nocardioidaceae bacterium]|nr:class SAM-dependent methyltransferase [Nocardioidaceae bacterium]
MKHDHTATATEAADATDFFTEAFWDDRYGSADMVWSGSPNPHLVTYASDLGAGTALDVGSGEGADAIWLAHRGWHVTGLDLSNVALRKAAARAAQDSPETARRITWKQVDLLAEEVTGSYDPVSAQFMHLPRPALRTVHRSLAAAVAPGGTLLIVGHHPVDHHVSREREAFPDILFTAEQVAELLDPSEWHLIETFTHARTQTDAEGASIAMHDAVLRAVRR